MLSFNMFIKIIIFIRFCLERIIEIPVIILIIIVVTFLALKLLLFAIELLQVKKAAHSEEL